MYLVLTPGRSGAHFELMTNAILSELIWGVVDPIIPGIPPTEQVRAPQPDGTQFHMPFQLHLWRPISVEPTFTPPTDGAMSYEEFLEKYLKLERADRKRLKHLFTEEGQVCHISILTFKI